MISHGTSRVRGAPEEAHQQSGQDAQAHDPAAALAPSGRLAAELRSLVTPADLLPADILTERLQLLVPQLLQLLQPLLPLPAEARRLIGRVAPDATGALRMLERQGFRHCDEVDPFDGGPYVEAERDEVPLVRSTVSRRLAESCASSAQELAIVIREGDDGMIKAIQSEAAWSDAEVALPAAAVEALGAAVGDQLSITPLSAKEDVSD